MLKQLAYVIDEKIDHIAVFQHPEQAEHRHFAKVVDLPLRLHFAPHLNHRTGESDGLANIRGAVRLHANADMVMADLIAEDKLDAPQQRFLGVAQRIEEQYFIAAQQNHVSYPGQLREFPQQRTQYFA